MLTTGMAVIGVKENTAFRSEFVLEMYHDYDENLLFYKRPHALFLRFDWTMNNILETSFKCL